VLVDHYDEDWTRLWWARADGTARVLQNAPERVDWLVTKYPQYGEIRPSGPVIQVTVERWSGWASQA
jgi:hypothetical protein